MSPTTLFAPGAICAATVSTASVSTASIPAAPIPIVRHAGYAADRVGGPAVISLPAPLLVLSAEAALGDLQAVPVVPSVIPPVVPSIIPPVVPSVKAVAATVESVAALSTGAISVLGQRGEGQTLSRHTEYRAHIVHLLSFKILPFFQTLIL